MVTQGTGIVTTLLQRIYQVYMKCRYDSFRGELLMHQNAIHLLNEMQNCVIIECKPSTACNHNARLQTFKFGILVSYII